MAGVERKNEGNSLNEVQELVLLKECARAVTHDASIAVNPSLSVARGNLQTHRPPHTAVLPQGRVKPVKGPTLRAADAIGAEPRHPRLGSISCLAPARSWQMAGPAGLCSKCCLPIGRLAYCADDDGYGEGSLVHAECKAQIVLQSQLEAEAAKLQEESARKQESREKYGIGWKVEKIPCNTTLADKLQCTVAPKGTCCVVLDEASWQVQFQAATDPVTSVNVEYLALALQVRKKEAREPVFSLDPEGRRRGATLAKDVATQQKRFEPEWLAETSVGEVMFQADYHLKEISMGACQPPVVGLKSCLEDAEQEGSCRALQGRVWFVVRKADVALSQDGALIPSVEMAVEAREKASGPSCQDARITRPDHPLTKYAERFSHFFDLIAERRSAIFYLRELAKASVLAKFLVEGGFQLPDAWFSLASEEGTPSVESLTIPQLRSERCRQEISVRDGEIMAAEDRIMSCTHSVFGGVHFGLDKENLVQPKRYSPMRNSALAHPSRQAAASLNAVSQSIPFTNMGRPRGVDLNLDKFNFSTSTWSKTPAPRRCWLKDSGDQTQGGEDDVRGEAFWAALDSEADGPFKEEDKGFLAALFNPHLSDRRKEGELFTPPDARQEYTDKLHALLKDEQDVREQRVQHFSSKGFNMEDAGPVFPSSWTPSVKIAFERGPGSCVSRGNGRKPSQKEACWLRSALRAATPLFDKSAEDGMRFRAYQIGDLEVRTTQCAPNSMEAIEAIFSSHAQAAEANQKYTIKEQKVVKVTEYVEALNGNESGYPATGKELKKAEPDFAYFVVLETENHAAIVTDVMQDGAVSWSVNPPDLEVRRTKAKVWDCIDCSSKGITVGGMQAFQKKEMWCSGHKVPWVELIQIMFKQ